MTVTELIEALSKHKPETVVLVQHVRHLDDERVTWTTPLRRLKDNGVSFDGPEETVLLS